MAREAKKGDDKAHDKTIKKLWEDCFKAILKQEWKKALASLEQLASLEADNPQVHLKIGDVLQRTGDRSGALAAYHRTATSLIGRGFKQKALAVYKVILRLEPNDGEALSMSQSIVDEIETEKGTSPFGGLALWSLDEETPSQDVPGQSVAQKETAVPDDAALPDEPVTSRVSWEGRPAEQGAAPEKKMPWIFSSLSEEEFADICGRAAHLSFKDGEAVVREGEPGSSMYTIEDGRARVTTRIQDRTVELAVLSEGDFFGEIAFLTGRPRTASVSALGELRVMNIGRDVLQEVLDTHPLIMDSLVEFYYSRVKNTLMKVKKR